MSSRAARAIVFTIVTGVAVAGCSGGDSVDPVPSVRTVTVSNTGTGTGTVTSSPAGINCGSGCSASLTTTAPITLTAAPAANSQFAGWSGACTGTSTACSVPAGTSAVAATARFDLTYTLTAALAGIGTGSVTSAPAGITCGTDCTEAYASGTTVTLTAAPAVGSTFLGWSGSGCTGTGTCVVTMTQAAAVTATFTLTINTLTVARAGTGTGSVTSVPAGINCGADCTEGYTFGTSVTLTAAAAVGSTFAGWSGACTGVGTCVVTMNAATSVTASFSVIAAGRTWPDSWTQVCTDLTAAVACPGGPAGQDGHYVINPPNYTTDAARVVDPTTGLEWERNPPTTNISHALAISYCENLVLAGFDDWRVPSYLEMVSLIDFGRVGPPFASTPFPGIPSNSFYWLSTDRAGVPAEAYGINTNYAVTRVRTKTETDGSIARCVRGTGFSGGLAVAGGSVTDARTGLVWQSATASTDMTWVNALAYCEALVLDTRSDWRLPNGKELMSIVDPTLANPSISPVFSSRPATVFWTSSALPGLPADAYAINFNFGVSDGINTPTTALRSVRCVR